MLNAIHCNLSDRTFHKYSGIEQLNELRTLKKDSQSILWLDLSRPSEQDLNDVAEKFQLHPLAIEDASLEHQRPKIDEYEEFVFIVFYTAQLGGVQSEAKTLHAANNGRQMVASSEIAVKASKKTPGETHEVVPQVEGQQELHMLELDIFLGSNYIITVHNDPIIELEEAELRWKRNERHADRGVGMLLYALMDAIVDRYFPLIDVLVEQADELEERLFSGQLREAKLTQELLKLRRQFLKMRRVVTPERDVLNLLMNFDSPRFNKHIIPYFRDVYDHISRIADTLDLYRDQLSTTMDANLSIVSNNLNKVMRTLTVASIILMVDSLIAGIYGMNFDYIPELHLPYGYFGALALMLGLAVGLILLFKRMKWL